MGHGHQHANPRAANSAALRGALLLTGTFLIAEVIGGILTGSLALISDAMHMLTDTFGLAIALAAIKVGSRPADSQRTFGYQRFEVLAATSNAVILFGVAGYILYEGYKRIVEPEQIQSVGMLVIAVIGLVINLISMRLLAAGQAKSLNVKGAYLEVWSDMLGSIGVIAAAAIIWLTGWLWVDAVVAIGIGLWVLPRAWSLLQETTNILLEGVPEGIDYAAVAAALRQVPGVKNLHDLHIWALGSDTPALSVHLVLEPDREQSEVREMAGRVLSEDFHISHVTLQLELRDCREGIEDHVLHA
ncbi:MULTISPECIES: cation diffusion facilitator family transporter [unclassified Hyphomicrobium]|jgi:cobalt-zinc-cadmium efflux system protein|uniref:cation diffusion facilitator family transporter n=1 Tax=unclassified Hyphomicrobium TaxID=2619925 RepID=UPI0009306081|nr:cation diffusion facilitator family transporter [Hyphomicrobium sp. NDB2Meth4]